MLLEKRCQVERWLYEYLTNAGGEADSNRVKEAGAIQGYLARKLQRALDSSSLMEHYRTDTWPSKTIWRIADQPSAATVNPSLSLDTTPDAEWRQPVMSTNNDATPIKYQDGVIVYASVAVAVRDNDGTWKRYNVLESTSERKTAGAALTALGQYLASTPFLTAWDAGLQYLPTKPTRIDGGDQW